MQNSLNTALQKTAESAFLLPPFSTVEMIHFTVSKSNAALYLYTAGYKKWHLPRNAQ